MAEPLVEPHVLEYPGGYTRSVGPVIGRFLTGLRDGRIEAVKLADGRVLVPPTEYDPSTSAPVAADGPHWIEVGPRGTVQTFTWVAQPRAGQAPAHEAVRVRARSVPTAPTPRCSTWSTAAGPTRSRVGMRVAPRWRADRTGHITDIEAWVPLGDGEEPEPAAAARARGRRAARHRDHVADAARVRADRRRRHRPVPRGPRRGKDHRRPRAVEPRRLRRLARHRPDHRRRHDDRGRGAGQRRDHDVLRREHPRPVGAGARDPLRVGADPARRCEQHVLRVDPRRRRSTTCTWACA